MMSFDNIKIELDILNNQKNIHEESKTKLEKRLDLLNFTKNDNDMYLKRINNGKDKVLEKKDKIVRNKNNVKYALILTVILTYIITTIGMNMSAINISYFNYIATCLSATLCTLAYIHKLTDVKETINVLDEYIKEYSNDIYEHEINNKELVKEIDLINNEIIDIDESIKIINNKIKGLENNIETIIGPQIPKELVDLEEGKARKLIRE